MASILLLLALNTLVLLEWAVFLLLAAALWIVFTPIFRVWSLIYLNAVSLTIEIAFWISQGDMPEEDVASLAATHLLQRRTVLALRGLLRSVSERVASLVFLHLFAFYWGLLLATVLFRPVVWALQPLWRGFRDWSAVRAIAVEWTRHVVVSVSGFLVDLQYEYWPDQWREDSSSPPSLRHRLFTALDFVRKQVWLISLSSTVFNLARGLSHRGCRAIKDFIRTALESPRIPSLVKTPLSAFIVMAIFTEDGLIRKGVETWSAIFTKPASNFVSEVHDTEQESKREQNQRIYRPLYPSKEMIRILRILPGIEGQALQCFIHIEQRTSAKYEALSYVWGDPTLQRFITLNGTRHFVGKNLYEFLVHLRRATTERELWVDAICINQADSDERTQQVLLMGDLYKRAERVIVWLGLDVQGVLELFGQASEHRETESNDDEQACLRPAQSGNSDAIQHLLGSPWWTRVWTIQELILGSSIIVQCGKQCLLWESFCQVIYRNASQMRPPDLETTLYSQYLALKRERQLYHQHVVRRYPLLELTYTFRGKQTSLAVDKIFGFYGLLEDPSAEIRPEYALHNSIVEESFAIDFINRYKSLAVIAMAELSTPEDVKGKRWEWYPRWRQDGSTSAKTLFWTGLGDEIGGQPWSENGFDAAHGRLVRAECKELGRPYNYGIALEGWHTDSVASTSAVMSSEDVDGGRWEPVLEQWLGMTCGTDGPTDGDTWRREKFRLFYKTITAGLFDDEQSPASRQHAKFEAAVRQACRCRRLLFTSSGRYGLGSQDTACGDEVWVLLGMAVPVVLGRRVASFSYDSEDYRRKEVEPDEPFRYFGQAYIDELMRPGKNTSPVDGLSEEALETVHIWSNGV